MQGHFALMLHAHLPFVRHPEHEKFLEENWLFEAITETYVPLLQFMEGWQNDGMKTRLTMSMSPPLCAMLLDPMLQERYVRHLDGLIQLAENEIHRTHWDPAYRALAWMYHHRFSGIRETYFDYGRNLVGAFRKFQDNGLLEIATCAATHALLPLLADDPPSLRAQIFVARDYHRECFGRDPRGIWLPECAFIEGIEKPLQEANIRWFVTEMHGLLHARPRPRYGVFAPVFTPNGVAAFGRDFDSARQVWSTQQGYPGDPRYRDFYRDIGFDLDFDYVKPFLPAPDARGFTGIKYHRITGDTFDKQIYDRDAAVRAADEHAGHFLRARVEQIAKLGAILDRPPLVLSPYDAELFGHWWYEGPEFLNFFIRKAYYDQQAFTFITPGEYLRRYPTQQVAMPAASSWGEEGFWRVWLNETNEWIYPHLRIAQSRMTALAERFSGVKGVQERALKQAARELLLAQSSDWPFILRSGTSPDYAARRVKEHLSRFLSLYEQLSAKKIDAPWLSQIEQMDNIFPNVNYRYWARP
ncbi:MAG: 1,4-alpha-glucan branching protein domain-containing protein [Verrucomicrobiota bacterium]|jgi:1,4-alpha-glucan branching enzyme